MKKIFVIILIVAAAILISCNYRKEEVKARPVVRNTAEYQRLMRRSNGVRGYRWITHEFNAHR